MTNVYTATTDITVAPADAWIEGPSSLDPGGNGVYKLRTASQNPIDPRAALEESLWYPFFAWVLGPNLETVESTPTTITVRSKRISEDDEPGRTTLRNYTYPIFGIPAFFEYNHDYTNDITLRPVKYSPTIPEPDPDPKVFEVILSCRYFIGNEAFYNFHTAPNDFDWEYTGSHVWEYALPDPFQLENYGIYVYSDYISIPGSGGWGAAELVVPIDAKFAVRATRNSPYGMHTDYYYHND